MLEDIAIVTGGRVISEEAGLKLENADLSLLGEARRIVSTKETTTIVGGKGAEDEIQKRIKQIKVQIEQTTSDFDREKLEERVAKLSGGVAVIKVGAATETELKEKKFRIEDAVAATRAAIEEGIVAGGGVAFFEASLELPITPTGEGRSLNIGDEAKGMMIIQQALQRPIRVIAENAGKDSNDVLSNIIAEMITNKGHKHGFGFNAAESRFGNMFEEGIIDPLKVVRTALQNAASVSSMILTTEVVITDIPEKKEKAAPGMHSEDY